MSNLQYYWYRVLGFFGWRSKFSKQVTAPIPENVREELRRRSREGTLPRRCLKDERQQRVEEMIHNGELSGFTVTPEFERDSQKYIDGEISVDELVRITRERYGLEDE